MRIVLVALAAVILLSGCAPFACTTIGYSSTLVANAPAGTAAVECLDCGEEYAEFEEVEPGVWRMQTVSSPPSVTLVALDAAGVEIARTVAEPVWVADDPGAACGSSMTSEPIEIDAR